MSFAPADRLLRWTAGLLWAAAAAAAAAAVWLPYQLPSADPTPSLPRRAATGPTTTAAVGSLDDVLDVVLRRPLADPPRPAATTATAPTAAVPAGPPVRLAGIVTEPGHTVAVFLTQTGATEVRAVGERAGGAEVVAIGTSAVTVRYDGRLLTLSLPSAPQPADRAR